MGKKAKLNKKAARVFPSEVPSREDIDIAIHRCDYIHLERMNSKSIWLCLKDEGVEYNIWFESDRLIRVSCKTSKL